MASSQVNSEESDAETQISRSLKPTESPSRYTFSSSSHTFDSGEKVENNFNEITGYDVRRDKNDNFSSKRGSKQSGRDASSPSFSLSVEKIDERGRLISDVKDGEDYVDNSVSSQENPSHEHLINSIDSTRVGWGERQRRGNGRLIGIKQDVKMDEPFSATRSFQKEDDRHGEVISISHDCAGKHDINGLGGISAAGVDEVTKVGIAPLSRIRGDNKVDDNPGHVYYGNDDDNDNGDDNRDASRVFVPLKTSIPPVGTPSLDGVGTSATHDDVGKDASRRAEGQISLMESGKPRDLPDFVSAGAYTDKATQKSESETYERNRFKMSSNFGDFPDEFLEGDKEPGCEDFNESSKQTMKNSDNLATEEESQISISSSAVPVPFSQALNYRRNLQCPVAAEQEEQSSIRGGCNSGGGNTVDESNMFEGTKDSTFQNEKDPSCALNPAVPSSGVGPSGETRDTGTRGTEKDGGSQTSGCFDDVDSIGEKHVKFSEIPLNQTSPSLVKAEVSVHSSQNATEVPENTIRKDEDSTRNVPQTAANASTSSGQGLQNMNFSGMLPFSEHHRLVSPGYSSVNIDQALGEFNVVDVLDERFERDGEEASGWKNSKAVERQNVELRKSLKEELDSSDVLVDLVDAPRKKSVAESAQDWLVEWTERKGKPEWTPRLHIRRELHRQKVLTQKTVKASGFVILKNTKRKRVQQLQNWWDNVTYTLALWGNSIRRIEGVHGSGVASYFLFLRWLFGLNIVLFAFMVSFTTIPMAILDEDSLEPSTDAAINTSYYCSQAYEVEKGSGVVAVLEFIQGTGWMEKTYLFYGYYVHALQATYNLPLAYMLTVLACLVISLVLMARYTGKSFREALLNAANTNFEYSNKVFGAWDYSLRDLNAAEQKQKGIHDDIQGDMLEQTFMRKRIERLEQRCSRCKLYSLRLLINFLILILLGAAAYLIYYVTSWSTEYAEDNKDASGTDAWLLLLVQYLPSLTITICNVTLPLIFEKVVILEDYSQAFVIQITLIRTVFLRLASLIVLVISLYSEVSCTPKDSCNANTGSDCTELKCWETYVGQQFYKLAIMDFLVVIVKVFLVELPRRFAAAKCDCGLIKALGPPEFNIPANVLDLVYGQCLVWLGFLFCPLLPGLNIAKLFIFFFVKKLSALVACPPTDRPYKASRVNVFFMVILLVAFSLCALPVMYSVFAIKPSKGCGPFLLFSSMNQALEKAVDSWPSALNITYDFLTSAAVTTIVIIFLAVAVYYLRSIGKAHKEQAALYREQLIMEGRDKQFLMSKLQEMYMPGQKAKQAEKEKDKKKKNKDKENVTIVDERGGYPPNDPPPNPYSPPNAPIDNQGGDW